MGWLEEQFGGDIAKAGDLIAGSEDIDKIEEYYTTNKMEEVCHTLLQE